MCYGFKLENLVLTSSYLISLGAQRRFYRKISSVAPPLGTEHKRMERRKKPSTRQALNPRPLSYEACALPLSMAIYKVCFLKLCRYESHENMAIQCSTKVCSFGKQVVEKLETEYAKFENGRFVYKIQRSPMCEYMINFIHKLKHLPEKYMMNSVLENFTILQVRLFLIKDCIISWYY